LTPKIALSQLMGSNIESLDPSLFPRNKFELWSIPAFDAGKPEILPGSEIGSVKKLVQPGDVLLSRIVPHIRRAWVVTPSQEGLTQIASGEWIVFRGRGFDPNYLRHVLISDEFHASFMSTVAGVGGSLLRARPDGVKLITIPLPHVADQKRIATILDHVDSLRQKRRSAIRLAAEIHTATFSELMKTAIGNGACSVTTLAQFADIIVGFPFPSAAYSNDVGDVRLCRGANVMPGRLDWSDVVFWPSSDIKRYEKFELKEDDIVIAMDRPWISSGFKISRISDDDLPALLLQRVARVRAKTKEEAAYLYALLKGSEFTRHCKPTETTVPHISPTEIKNFPVRLIPEMALRSFMGQINNLSELERFQTAQLLKIDALFTSLQDRAFRGELTSKAAERELAEAS
jgi:type I restriction enzyme, S subunit